MLLCPWEEVVTSQRHSALGGGRDAFERTLDSRATKIPPSEEGGYDITGPEFLKLRCPGVLDHAAAFLSPPPLFEPRIPRRGGPQENVPACPKPLATFRRRWNLNLFLLRRSPCGCSFPRALLMSSESTHQEALAYSGSFSSLLHFQLRSPASSSSTPRFAHEPQA